jgi:hypothetical protein
MVQGTYLSVAENQEGENTRIVTDDVGLPVGGVPADFDEVMLGFKNSIEISDRGGTSLGVTLQDQTTGVLDVPFLLNESSPTLAADTVVNSRDITLTAGHGLINQPHPAGNIGDVMEIADTTNGSFFMQCGILAIVGDVVTLDCPVNRIYTTANSLLSVSHIDMNVDGSVTPVIFSILPFSLQKGDMTRVIVEMRSLDDMDFTTFGGLPELTNGCVIRVNNGDGTYRNLYNFKSNGDIIEQCYDHRFLAPRGGNVTNGFTARLTWAGQSKHGVAIRLDGSLGESLEFIVQDDLTDADGLIRMHWTGQGSELQGD